MKKLLTCTALLICCLQLHAQNEPNNYHAIIGTFKYLYNNSMGDSLYSLYAPEMKKAVSADQNKNMITDLHGKFGVLNSYSFIKMQGYGIYRMVFANTITIMSFTLNSDNKITGLYFRPYDPKQFAPDSTAQKSNFVCNATNCRLYGTISCPDDNTQIPIVIIVAGSGPTDRDGNSNSGAKPYSYRMLADSLIKYHIACLRYDKRGIGESIGYVKSEDSLRFDDMVTDLTDIIAQIKKDNRFSQIFVVGHSEGSLVGMLAAQKEKIDGFVSLAGTGRPAAEVMKEQFIAAGAKAGSPLLSAIDSLQNGMFVQNIPANRDNIFRKSVQPYLISWFKYDPRIEIKKLKIPVLIVLGNTDMQISLADANLLHNANKRSHLEIIKGMNHVLKEAPLDRKQNIITYSDPVLPVKTELVQIIQEFVNN